MKTKKVKSTAEKNKVLKIKKECERNRLAKIKSDPELKAKQKEKERQKYLRKKEKGIVKSITDLPVRDQKKQRKEWKINSRKYSQKVRMLENDQL